MNPSTGSMSSRSACATSRMRAVVLAAGAGERMGRRPKCLLELDGVPIIRRTLAALSAVGVERPVTVLGHHADAIAPCIEGLGVTVQHHFDPDPGPVSSQRLGLGALCGRIDAVMVVLADQPLIDAPALAALIKAWEQRPAGAEVLVPRVDGQRGNPVILSASVREDILHAGAGFGCRQWQATFPDRVHVFDCGHRGFVWDVDSEDDIRRLHEATGQVLRWPSS